GHRLRGEDRLLRGEAAVLAGESSVRCSAEIHPSGARPIGDRTALLRGDVPAALLAQIAHLEVGWRQAAPSDILVARY
ncbi:MAG: hypothetical protein WKF32_06060, partial [Thermoleophilaceae bacterium]